MPTEQGDAPTGAAPRVGRPRTRSADDVVRAAVAVADADGLDAVTMRRVAAELGGGPSSLYRYVRDRSELLELALDAVAEEYRLPPPTGEPLEDLVEVGRQARAVMQRHPWAAELVVSTPGVGPNGLAVLEHVLAVLDGTPSAGPPALELFALLMGHVALEVLDARQAEPDVVARRVGRLQAAAASGDHPHLAAVLAGPPGPPSDAETRLRRLLHGLVLADGAGWSGRARGGTVGA